MNKLKLSPQTLAPVALALLTLAGVALWTGHTNAQDKDGKDKAAAPKPALTVTAVQPRQSRLAVARRRVVVLARQSAGRRTLRSTDGFERVKTRTDSPPAPAVAAAASAPGVGRGGGLACRSPAA